MVTLVGEGGRAVGSPAGSDLGDLARGVRPYPDCGVRLSGVAQLRAEDESGKGPLSHQADEAGHGGVSA